MCTSCIQIAPTQRLSCDGTISLHWGLNPGPLVYKTGALPRSYRGFYERGYKPNNQYYWAQGHCKEPTQWDSSLYEST